MRVLSVTLNIYFEPNPFSYGQVGNLGSYLDAKSEAVFILISTWESYTLECSEKGLSMCDGL